MHKILTSVINATPDIIFYKDYLTNDGAYLGCNDAFAKFVGKSKDDIIGHNDIELFGEDVGNFFRKKDREMLLQNTTVVNEEWVTYPDGTKVLLHTSKAPLMADDGNVIGVVGVSHDITKLHENTQQIEKQNKALEDQKELYELVFKNTASSILIIDIDANKFTDCNDQAIALLKTAKKEDVLNLQPADLSPEYQPDGRKSSEKSNEMNAIALEKGTHTFEWKHIRPNGEEFWVEVVLTLITLKGRKVLHVVWKDIDDKKKTEENLKVQQLLLIQQSRMASMGEMIGNIAHQWRQPLNTLSLIIANIKDAFDYGELDESTFQESTIQANAIIQGMSQTIDDFRNFFSPNKVKQLFNPKEAIEDAFTIIDNGLRRENIKVIRDMTSDCTIESYKNEFSQVMLNLLNNAKEALLENKTLSPTIAIKQIVKNEYIFITVQDNGGGISKSIISKIFDPYFTTKADTKGTGIGLYMSKIIIEEHMNGQLTVENKNKGALFTIRLPINSDAKLA